VPTYSAASQFWRTIPVRTAEPLWLLRGWSIAWRAARHVEAYRSLRAVLEGGSPRSGFGGAGPAGPVTGWTSYVQVYPLEQRCCDGRLHRAVLFEPITEQAGRTVYWPRGRSELATLREQLAGLLAGQFAAGTRKTLAVLALPRTGWCSSRRIAWCLQQAAERGRLRVTAIEVAPSPSEIEALLGRLAGRFDQCLLLADAGLVGGMLPRWDSWQGRIGVLLFGRGAGLAQRDSRRNSKVLSVWGIDEVGPLIGAETPLSRLVWLACQSDRKLAAAILPEPANLVGFYQALPRGPYVEQSESGLLVSAWQLAPVIRYRTGHAGRVIGFAQAWEQLDRHGWRPAARLRQLARGDARCWKLPLIALMGD